MILNRLAIVLIRVYQNTIGIFMPGRCRFHPTCSQYSAECFQEFGFVKAFGKSAYRILRCNPFSKGYMDPVISHNDCDHDHNNGSATPV